jgi:hypothetical protein
VDRPMRVYGQNVYEIVLTDYLVALGVELIALAIATGIVPATLAPSDSVGAGLLAGGAVGAGLLLVLASGGVRQNRGAVDMGLELLAAVGAAWLVWGIVAGVPVPIAVGAVLLAHLALVYALRRQGLRARFKPRYLSPRQFETMIQIVDVMIDGDGREAVAPEEVAVGTDHLLHDIRSPTTDEIRTVITLAEFALPLVILRPLPFSALGTAQRRRAIERVIDATGPFRDIARTLKLIACAGYYGHPDAIRSIGFVQFDERARFPGTDTSARVRPDPFEREKEPVA